MTNPYFNNTITLIPGQTARAGDVEDKCDLITTGFDLVDADVVLKAPILSPTFTGIPTTTTPTGANSAQIVNVTYLANYTAGVTSLGDLLDIIINTSGTAAVNTRENVDTTSGVITRTLPSSPTNYQIIGFKDKEDNFDTNKLVIQPATGHRIEDSAINEAMDVTEKYAYFALKWYADDLAWRVL